MDQALLGDRWRRIAAIAGCLGTFAAAAGPAHAADRAFELVTPLTSLAQIDTAGSFTTDDGNIVFFASGESLAGAVPNGPYPTVDSYMSRRGPGGWSTEWVTDVADAEPGTAGSRTMFATQDGALQVMTTENAIDPGDTVPHSVDSYLRDVRSGRPTYTWLAPGPRTVPTAARVVLSATRDLDVLLVETEAPLVPADVNGTTDLYVIRNGTPELVAVTPGGTAGAGSGYMGAPNLLTPDGETVFFFTTAQLDPADTDTRRDLYRRAGDGTVTLFSPYRRGVALTASLDVPRTLYASADGDVACFETQEALLDEDTTPTSTDVYCYTASTDTLELASVGSNDFFGRGVALSDDGSTMFFSTATRLTDADDDGGRSLYAYRLGGGTHYVAPLAPDDESRGRVDATEAPSQRAIRIAPDGSAAFFVTSARVASEDLDTDIDVYRWTLDGGTELISTAPGPGGSTIGSAITEGDVFTKDGVLGRVVTADFRTLYFTSQVPHDPADTDGGFWDVYEWTESGGIRLLSPPGEAPYDAHYLDNAVDGSSVFFVTAEPIHPLDVNAARDVYVSRVGGGFETPPSVPGCTGESCQGPIDPAPPLPVVGTASYESPGDVVEAERPFPTHRLLPITRGNLRALARTGRTQLRVRITEGGSVTIRVTARIGRKSVRVAGGRGAAARAATLRIPIRLSARARKQLRQRGRLRLVVTATYSEADNAIRRGVTLRAR